MIEAWLSASETMASSSPSSASKTPPLASKQEEKRMASSKPKKAGESPLQLPVQVLGAADEAHRGEAVAARVEGRPRRGEQLRVVGEPEVVVGAEVEHPAPAHLDLGPLRATG